MFNVLKEFYEPMESLENKVWVSEPTWPNHQQMALLQGLNPQTYRYYNLDSRTYNFEGMVEDLQSLPEYAPVIFHPVGHNPTGFDPSHEQWHEILEISK